MDLNENDRPSTPNIINISNQAASLEKRIEEYLKKKRYQQENKNDRDENNDKIEKVLYKSNRADNFDSNEKIVEEFNQNQNLFNTPNTSYFEETQWNENNGNKNLLNQLFQNQLPDNINTALSNIQFENCKVKTPSYVLNINQMTSIGIKPSRIRHKSSMSSSALFGNHNQKHIFPPDKLMDSITESDITESTKPIAESLNADEYKINDITIPPLENLQESANTSARDAVTDTFRSSKIDDTIIIPPLENLQESTNTSARDAAIDTFRFSLSSETASDDNNMLSYNDFLELNLKLNNVVKENINLRKSIEEERKLKHKEDKLHNKQIEYELHKMKDKFSEVQCLLLKQNNMPMPDLNECSTQTWDSAIICSHCVKTLEMLQGIDQEKMKDLYNNRAFYVAKSDFDEIQNNINLIKKEIQKRELDYENRKERAELIKYSLKFEKYRSRIHELEQQSRENMLWINTLQTIIVKIYTEAKMKNLTYVEQKCVNRIVNKYVGENFTDEQHSFI